MYVLLALISITFMSVKSSLTQAATIAQKNPLGVAVVGVGGFLLIKYILSKASAPKSNSKLAEDEIVKLQKKGVSASITPAQASGLADSIYRARHGNNVLGTDEDAIYNAFSKIKNEADLYLVIKAFGNRRLSFSFQDAGLHGYLSDELDQDEISKVNRILSSKRINYQF